MTPQHSENYWTNAALCEMKRLGLKPQQWQEKQKTSKEERERGERKRERETTLRGLTFVLTLYVLLSNSISDSGDRKEESNSMGKSTKAQAAAQGIEQEEEEGEVRRMGREQRPMPYLPVVGRNPKAC